MSEQKLRCWPGCVAIINETNDPDDRWLVGKTFTLTAVYGRTKDGAAVWGYEGPSLRHPKCFDLELTGLVDPYLTPITPPPELQITDEPVQNDVPVSA